MGLKPGHLYQTWGNGTQTLAEAWPTPWPGRWHLALTGYPLHVTTKPLTEGELEALLAEWRFQPPAGLEHIADWPSHPVQPKAMHPRLWHQLEREQEHELGLGP